MLAVIQLIAEGWRGDWDVDLVWRLQRPFGRILGATRSECGPVLVMTSPQELPRQ